MDNNQIEHLKGAVEALLFVSEKPVTAEQFKDAIIGVSADEIKVALDLLEQEYASARRGMVVIQIAGGWQMLSSGDYASYIREFFKTRHKEKLSRPALEVLAIIAYKQPVSRTDLELLRGVNSDGVVIHLLNKGLIKIVGRKEVPGRPYVYGTTGLFLEYFGLRALSDLPKLEEFPGLAAAEGTSGTSDSAGLQQELAQAVSGEYAPTAEDLAKARTRMDIDELEKDMVSPAEIADGDIVGSVGGQARMMSAENAPQEEADRGTEESASEDR